MTTAADPRLSPASPRPCRRCASPIGASPPPWRLSSPTTPSASTVPSGVCSTTGATRLDLRSRPAEPLTVARYLAVRVGSDASIATLRLATSAIAKAHQWAGQESPGRDRGVREALKSWGRRLAWPQRQAGALTADVLAVIRLTAVQPRRRGRGIETPEQAAERGKFDVALVAALSDAGLRRSEAASLTWGDVQRWDDSSGRITVARSKTDAEAQGAVVAITPAAMQALSAIRPVGAALR